MSETPEAAASMNVRFASQQGFEYMLTVRSFVTQGSGKALLDTIPSIEKKLAELDCKPIFGKNAATPAAKPVDAEHPETKPCPVHPGMNLNRKEKDGKIWYSHKLDDGSWCNEK